MAPAAIADLTRWSSLTVAEAKRGLEMIGDTLEKRTIDGLDYWAETLTFQPASPQRLFHAGPRRALRRLPEDAPGGRHRQSIGPWTSTAASITHSSWTAKEGTRPASIDKTGVTFEARMPACLLRR